jgi:mannose/cellobiose epimerase-like protein (N-acyl-D-glucosamine 2-epimerase family)
MGAAPAGWLESPAHHRWLERETLRLLDFAEASRRPGGGFAWLDATGRPALVMPDHLWITCRMTHVFAIGHLLGRPGSAAFVDHGVSALRGAFRDAAHGGWYGSVTGTGPAATSKEAYGQAFVVLAASSAAAARRPGADALLGEALEVLAHRFWDDDAGMVVEEWDEPFQELDGYRGLNSNMHAVEALLAAYDVTGDGRLRDMAVRITTTAYGFAREHDWRIPEHFDATWRPVLDYNEHEPTHPFRPFGATVGHWFEWARLGLQLHGSLGPAAPPHLAADAVALFEASAREGWAADGVPGFVYTVDWEGRPVVRQRMHWVAAEAVAAAAAVWRSTGDPRHAALYEQWWDHVAGHFVDRRGGSWWHELDPELRPDDSTWSGKPDAYHAVQATLLPRLPTDVSLAAALAAGRLG